jgi:C-terminal processing protease CtpA/Prc
LACFVHAMQVQRSGSFDPTEFAGSDEDSSDFASETGEDGECGIGVSVCKDERGFFRVTEVVMGGAADQASALRVGDILRSVDGHIISVDMRSNQVLAAALVDMYSAGTPVCARAYAT